MPPPRWKLPKAISALEGMYGTPLRLPATDPFERVVWESCAYLVDDARRRRVFLRLNQATGLDPERIAGMRPAALAELITAEGGMQPPMRAAKL